MISLTPIVSRAKNKRYKAKKGKKLALNSQLLTDRILTNDVQVLILCLYYLITTVYCFLIKMLYKTFHNQRTETTEWSHMYVAESI